jgi:flagellar biogenesis protein FliO
MSLTYRHEKQSAEVATPFRPTPATGVDLAAPLVDCPQRAMGPYAGYLIETFVTLLAVCGLAFVVLYGARRLGIGRPRGPIQLVGQLPLDARRAIYLVQVGGQVLVVGASEAGITKLGEVAAKELPAVEVTGAAPFSDVLARILRSKKADAKAKGDAP